jgi:outer membrane murein-binding lipoprotein Lpp
MPRPKGCVTLPAMSADTKAIIGTIVGTGLALAGLLSAQIAGVNARVDDVRADMREMRSDMREMRASMERFDSRLDAVEVALGKVDQRLLTIERVVLPSATPDE